MLLVYINALVHGAVIENENYQLVLVCRHGNERGFLEGEASCILGRHRQLVITSIPFLRLLDYVDPRLIFVHRIENHLQNN